MKVPLHDSQPALFVLMLAVFIILLMIAMVRNSARVETKEQDATNAWNNFPPKGIYRLIFYRQSGNFHKKLFVVNGDKSSVEAEIKKVFARAKINDDYMVSKRGEQIVYERAYAAYSPLGKRYSKGVGSCHVHFVTDVEIDTKKTVVAKNIHFKTPS
jgi:hypothetical protein